MQGRQCLLAGLVFCTSISAQPVTSDQPSNPYQNIIDRNVFALKPPPTPPDPEASKPPPSKITLTGITTILGRPRVLMKTPPPTGQVKAGEQPKGEQFYILSPGERDGDIEVLEVNEKDLSVKVNNGGKIETLTLAENGAKLPATAPPPAAPSALPAPGATVPTATGANPYAPATGKGGLTMPNRTLRSSVPGQANAAGAGNPAGFGSNAGVDPAALQRSPEENVALYEANRIKNDELRAAGVRVPRLPPHVFLGGQDQQAPAPGIQPAPAAQ